MGITLSSLRVEARKLSNAFYNRIHVNPKLKKDIIDNFHKIYYESSSWGGPLGRTAWLGIPTVKCPLDLWIYQDIIFELTRNKKPLTIIETGTYLGGSALYLASICDLVNNGKIISIDIENRPDKPKHKRINYLIGSSISNEVVKNVKKLIGPEENVMVILDADHSKDHVFNELKIYSEFVTIGSYIVAEDTNVNGNPVYPSHGPGPMEAVNEFVKNNTNFEIDKSREKFYITMNPNGYLKKIK